MNTAEKFIATPIVDVCGKRTLEYVAESLARFNRGADAVILRSISGNVSKAMEVAQILADGFDIEIVSANACRLEINGIVSGNESARWLGVMLYDGYERTGPSYSQWLGCTTCQLP